MSEGSSTATLNPIEQISHQAARFRNRGFLAILHKILVNSKQANTRTRLMYQANLSYSMTKLYLESAIDLELLNELPDKDGARRFYKITERGVEFLEAYNSLMELVPFLDEIDDF